MMGHKRKLKSDLKSFTMHIRDTEQAFKEYQSALDAFNRGFSARFVAAAWYKYQNAVMGLRSFNEQLAKDRPIEIWCPKAQEIIAGMTEIRLRKRK